MDICTILLAIAAPSGVVGVLCVDGDGRRSGRGYQPIGSRKRRPGEPGVADWETARRGGLQALRKIWKHDPGRSDSAAAMAADDRGVFETRTQRVFRPPWAAVRDGHRRRVPSRKRRVFRAITGCFCTRLSVWPWRNFCFFLLEFGTERSKQASLDVHRGASSGPVVLPSTVRFPEFPWSISWGAAAERLRISMGGSPKS